MNATEAADWLVMISNDLRAAGDLPLLRLSEDGVSQDAVSLADELWLVSVCVRGIAEGPQPEATQ